MTFQEALTSIQSAIYGEDVRGAIIEGIKLCYTERTSGGYEPVEDANEFQNGIAACTSSTAHRPYDAPFLLYSAGTDAICCQIAIDPEGSRSNSIRKKENGSWSDWTAVAEDAMYYIRYWSQNGNTLLYTERVSEGRNGCWNGSPTKTSSAQYDYVFAGWNTYPNQTNSTEGVLNNIRSNKDVYAAFIPVTRSYTVRFYNGSSLITSKTVPYGDDATYSGSTPTKNPTAQYSYTFSGWNTDSGASEPDSNALKNITSDRNLYAMYAATVRSYSVTFRNGSTNLQTTTVEYGGTAVYSGATPTKPSTAQYDYSFIGWNTVDEASSADPNATKNITGDRIIYAVFSSSILAYTVRFMNGATILETMSVEYGNNATYSGSTPTKNPTAQYSYTFSGWNTDPNATSADSNATKNIMADRDIYAIFASTLQSYTVTFMNGDTVLDTESVQYGSNATYNGTQPVKTSSAQYNYNFVGWNLQAGQSTADANALKNITGNRTVYAAFSASIRSYTVRFIDSGTILETKSVPYGNNVTYTGTEPSKADTAQYDYTFVGWNGSPDQSTNDENILKNITANRDIYSAYSVVVKSYAVSFYYNSQLLYTDTVEYGGTAVYNGSVPTKAPTAEYHYNFVGWSYLENQSAADINALTNVTANRTLYAAFETASNELTVTFYNGTTVVDTQTVNYGSNATYTGATPTKPATVYYTYTFAGWNSSPDQTAAEPGVLNNIVRDTIVYAAFSQTDVLYYVYFYNGSTLVDTKSTTYNGTVSYSGVIPAKPATAQYTYNFIGWNTNQNATTADANALKNVKATRTVYAVFSQTVNEYTVRFMNGTTVLAIYTVPYGSNAIYSGDTPIHPEEPEEYEFVGWEPDGTYITGDTDCQPVWAITATQTRALIDRTISGTYENSSATLVGPQAFAYCEDLEQVIFENATSIGPYAFTGCISMTKATFPKVSYIYGNAFRLCSSLSTLIVGTEYSSVCTLQNSYVFYGVPSSTIKIYVPDNKVAAYKSAANWSYVSSRISGSSYIPNN